MRGHEYVHTKKWKTWLAVPASVTVVKSPVVGSPLRTSPERGLTFIMAQWVCEKAARAQF